jgi:hypothetical protein
MVHNRILAVTPAERELFNAYCKEILEVLADCPAVPPGLPR